MVDKLRDQSKSTRTLNWKITTSQILKVIHV